jgi:predicted DNA-binding WGR domain protein
MDAGERQLIERAYLEFREGKSSKFYAVVRSAHADGTQSVSFNYGRIGSPHRWDERARRVPPARAAAEYAALVREKLREGYHEAEWPESLEAPAEEVAPLVPPFVAPAAGKLPPAGPLVVAGIPIPAGHPVAPGLAEGPDARPMLWMTDTPLAAAADLWAVLAAAFPSTGLWPLIIDEGLGLNDEALGDSASAGNRPLEEILGASWDENTGEDADELTEDLSPFSRGFPGLAAPTTSAFDPAIFEAVARSATGHLGLVPVERPADVVAAVGWTGWANYGFDPGAMAQVFRSWEERFGAVLVGLGFDILTFAVARPARNLAEATAIAAEHFAVSPDNIFQGAGTIRDYARELVHANAWQFWWD